MERPLHHFEKMIIENFAEKLNEEQKQQLLFDMHHSNIVENSEGIPYVTFHISGYTRAISMGKHSYPVEGSVLDADGVEIQVWLFADEKNRLYELEFARVDTKSIIAPDWSTLKSW